MGPAVYRCSSQALRKSPGSFKEIPISEHHSPTPPRPPSLRPPHSPRQSHQTLGGGAGSGNCFHLLGDSSGQTGDPWGFCLTFLTQELGAVRGGGFLLKISFVSNFPLCRCSSAPWISLYMESWLMSQMPYDNGANKLTIRTSWGSICIILSLTEPGKFSQRAT